jgi:hypothetical protein
LVRAGDEQNSSRVIFYRFGRLWVQALAQHGHAAILPSRVAIIRSMAAISRGVWPAVAEGARLGARRGMASQDCWAAGMAGGQPISVLPIGAA